MDLKLGVNIATAVAREVAAGADHERVIDIVFDRSNGARRDAHDLFDSLPDELRYPAQHPDARARARAVHTIAQELGSDLIARLERELPGRASDALDLAAVVADIELLGRMAKPDAARDAQDVASVKAALRSPYAFRDYLDEGHGRLSVAAREIVARAVFAGRRSVSPRVLEAAVRELCTNPALNGPEVQKTLVEGLVGSEPHEALRVLVTTARHHGLLVDISNGPIGTETSRALLRVLDKNASSPADAATVADAVVAAFPFGTDVVVPLLDEAAKHAGDPRVQQSLAIIALSYGRDPTNHQGGRIRQRALNLLEPNRGKLPGLPFAEQVSGVAWHRIARSRDRDEVMDAIRFLGDVGGIAPAHGESARRAAFRLALTDPRDSEANFPWMLRNLLRYADYETPRAVTALARTLRGHAFVPKKPRDAEPFEYHGPWNDPQSPAVSSKAIELLAPAHPTPGYWFPEAMQGLDALARLPQRDALSRRLVSYGLVDRRPEIVARCRELLVRDSGQFEQQLGSLVLAQALDASAKTLDRDALGWTFDFLLAQPKPGAQAREGGRLLAAYLEVWKKRYDAQHVAPLIEKAELLVAHLGAPTATFVDEATFMLDVFDGSARYAEPALRTLEEGPISVDGRRQLYRLIDKLWHRTNSAEAQQTIRGIVKVLSKNPELNPPDLQEAWIADVSLASTPRAEVAIELLRNQIRETGQLDCWLENRLPELERALQTFLNLPGDWFDVVSQLRSLLFALGSRTATVDLDVTRERLFREHGRSRTELRTFVEQYAKVDKTASEPGIAAKLAVARDLLAELPDWPDHAPEALRKTRLLPTSDIVDLGEGGALVAYPDERYLVTPTEVRSLTMDEAREAASWHPAISPTPTS